MKEEMGVAKTCLEYLRLLLRGITFFYLAVTAFLMPLYFDTETDYGAIGSNKSGLFQNWGFAAARMFAVIFVCFVFFALICWLKEHKGCKGKLSLLINELLDSLSVTDKFILFYLVILALSYYYTDYRDDLLMGADGWYMGFFPQLVFIGFYFAISRFLTKKQVGYILGGMLFLSAIVFTLGILSRYGVNPLCMESSGPSFISTIGNINWYCGYWSVLFPLGAGAFLFGERKRILLGFFVAIGFATGVTQGSDSGILTIVGLVLLTGCLCVGKSKRMKHFLQMLLIFCGVTILLSLVQFFFPERNEYITSVYTLLTGSPLSYIAGGLLLLLYLFFYTGHNRDKDKTAFALRLLWWSFAGVSFAAITGFIVLLLLNTKNPGCIGSLSENPAFVWNETWGSNRGGTWTLGLKTWWSQDFLHKLVGVGPDGMAYYIYSGADEALLAATKAQFGVNRLTNAHGEWITILANMGLFGLAGFAGMMISAIIRFIKKPAGGLLCFACGLSLFCYTVNNVFSFWQIMNITQMFIVLGMGECLLRKEKSNDDEDSDCGR